MDDLVAGKLTPIGTLARCIIGFAAALISAAIVATTASAQSADTYPERGIQIIVPFPPGGSVDVLGRTIAQKLNEAWGKPVVVENRAGASTIIGTTALAKAPPDGYTLMIAVSSHTTNPSLSAKLPFDPRKDFASVSLLARAPVVLYAHPSFPPNNLKELVAYAKTQDKGLNFASAGVGTMTHLTAEQFKATAKVEMTHIIYRGGTPAMNDLIAGHLPMQFGTVGQALPQYKAGALKALAVSSETRYPSIPEVPTFKEQGFDVVTTEWFGLLAPAGTPNPIIDKLNAEMKRILKSPDLGERLTAIELATSTPAELDAFILAETNRWSPLIKSLKLTIE
ncbi:MFS transporter [Afipia sp. P52-10]|uniref:tripartite tricarboxylate transporter substrate binding protein n=1 Tax=Afipia sp. P52-10 TaxID=1429916 RepID=UPI0003DF17D3|nr:tripartite tricarboxylate transporter substrate binding protein [Afipia sp. P52-10]ETR76217.1 MFS transporter [Afipia sp. P52-10]